MLKKIISLFNLGSRFEKDFTSYELNHRGYQKLYDEDEVLYDLCRSYLLNYAQEWDDNKNKQEELRHILSFVYLPFSIPKDRRIKLLKREFKRALNKIDCSLSTEEDSGYKLAMVNIANVLLEFKQRSKFLRNKIKK